MSAGLPTEEGRKKSTLISTALGKMFDFVPRSSLWVTSCAALPGQQEPGV